MKKKTNNSPRWTDPQAQRWCDESQRQIVQIQCGFDQSGRPRTTVALTRGGNVIFREVDCQDWMEVILPKGIHVNPPQLHTKPEKAKKKGKG